MDYKEIVGEAACRKLIDLAKSVLDILDELKREEAVKVSKFLSAAEEAGFGEKAKTLRHFLYLLDDEKKDIIRKRILDRTNELARELKS